MVRSRSCAPACWPSGGCSWTLKARRPRSICPACGGSRAGGGGPGRASSREAPPLDLPGVGVVSREGRQAELAFDPRATPAPDLIARIVAAYPVDDIHVEEPLIEEVIARFYDLHGAGEA